MNDRFAELVSSQNSSGGGGVSMASYSSSQTDSQFQRESEAIKAAIQSIKENTQQVKSLHQKTLVELQASQAK
ncbi:MAG: hypothetical protein SGCHY_003775, partial [Lobulomycetales sp.]